MEPGLYGLKMRKKMENKSYSLYLHSEPYYDIDELQCIIQQFEAIVRGYGMNFSISEEPTTGWIWEKN